MKKRKQLQSLLNHKANILLVGSPRSGKGVGWVIPTLLGGWTESAIVTDIRGENWEITGGYRQKKMGQKVIKFEPTASDGTSARFNPFNEVRFGTQYEISDIQNVVGIIVDPEGKGDLDDLILSVSDLLTGLVCHMHYAHIKDPSNNPPLTLNQLAITIGNMQTIYSEAMNLPIRDLNITHPSAFYFLNYIASKSENEIAPIISKANELLTLYLDPVLAMNTCDSDFTLYDVMNYKNPVTLYLITSPFDIKRVGPLFKLIIEMIVRNNTGNIKFENGKPVDTFKHRCLLLLDEFAELGCMDTFEKQLAYIPGYGLKVFMVCHGLQQLEQIYTKENSIVMNCPIKIFHNPVDVLTAYEIKNQLGREELDVFLSFYDDKELIAILGEKPILKEKLKYYMDDYFSSRVMNAPLTSDVIPKPF